MINDTDGSLLRVAKCPSYVVQKRMGINRIESWFVVVLNIPHGDWHLSTIDVPEGYSEG